MFDYSRLTALLFFVVTGILAGITVGIAQSPVRETETSEIDLPIPELQRHEPIIQAPARAQSVIRRALEGEAASDSGDPILDDVLSVIRRHGSVLDGSVLDQPIDEISKPASVVSERARTAEMMLRSARLLERVEPSDSSREQLIAAMRAEAAKLLME